MKIKALLTVVLSFVLTSLSPTIAAAEPGRFYVVPGLQWMDFDDFTGLDSEWGWSAGLGVQATERLSFELGTFDMDPDNQLGAEVDLDHYRLDALYDIGEALGNWQPFIVGGIGNTEFGNDNDTLGNIGAGLKLKLSDRVQWRTAVRSYHFLGRSFGDNDIGVDTGLVFFLGGSDRPAPAPRETASAPASRPASTPRVEPENEEPAPDADRDGVPDSGDACPDTPRTYAVDERGCPIPVEEVARVELLVNFDFDRSEVKPEYFDEIQEVTDFMDQYPDVVVELEGHTDSRGTEDYNQGLSERRASAVRDVMINEFGISAGRVTARGFGESQPVASNDTDAGREENRRVITVIIQTLQNYQPR